MRFTLFTESTPTYETYIFEKIFRLEALTPYTTLVLHVTSCQRV